MTDVERPLHPVGPSTEASHERAAGEVPPRSPEQRARMRRAFVAALDEQRRKDEKERSPLWKEPVILAPAATATALAAGIALWLWLHPREEQLDTARGPAPSANVVARSPVSPPSASASATPSASASTSASAIPKAPSLPRRR